MKRAGIFEWVFTPIGLFVIIHFIVTGELFL